MFDQFWIKNLKRKKAKMHPIYLISNVHHVEKKTLEVMGTSGDVTFVDEDG